MLVQSLSLMEIANKSIFLKGPTMKRILLLLLFTSILLLTGCMTVYEKKPHTITNSSPKINKRISIKGFTRKYVALNSTYRRSSGNIGNRNFNAHSTSTSSTVQSSIDMRTFASMTLEDSGINVMNPNSDYILVGQIGNGKARYTPATVLTCAGSLGFFWYLIADNWCELRLYDKTGSLIRKYFANGSYEKSTVGLFSVFHVIGVSEYNSYNYGGLSAKDAIGKALQKMVHDFQTGVIK